MAKLLINRGTNYDRTINYAVDGVATTLVGATVRFTMKSAEYDADTADTSGLIVKNITTGTSAGVAVISIIPTDTATLTPGPYFYDIKVQNVAGKIYKIDEGTIILDGSPTNRLA